MVSTALLFMWTRTISTTCKEMIVGWEMSPLKARFLWVIWSPSYVPKGTEQDLYMSNIKKQQKSSHNIICKKIYIYKFFWLINMIHTQLFLTIIDQQILYLHSFIYSKNSYWENKQKKFLTSQYLLTNQAITLLSHHYPNKHHQNKCKNIIDSSLYISVCFSFCCLFFVYFLDSTYTWSHMVFVFLLSDIFHLV